MVSQHDMRKVRRWSPVGPALILVLMAALVIPFSAQAQGGKDLMLRLFQVKSTAADASSPASRSFDEVLVFRDGLLLFVSNRDDGGSRSVRAQASEASLESLKSILVDDRVDRLAGWCDVSGVGGVLEGSEIVRVRRSLLTWYGVRSRRVRHLPIGHVESTAGQFGEPCSGSLLRVLRASLAVFQDGLTGPTATASPDENYPTSLLFEIRNALEEDPSCGDGGFVDDFHLFRDGLLVRRFRNAEGHYLISRAAVPSKLRRRLNATLTREQIGSLRGSCRTWFFIPFVVDGGCLDYAWESSAEWNGRNGRRGLVAGNDGAEATCPDSKARIRNQLMTTILNALSFVTVETVEGRVPKIFASDPRP